MTKLILVTDNILFELLLEDEVQVTGQSLLFSTNGMSALVLSIKCLTSSFYLHKCFLYYHHSYCDVAQMDYCHLLEKTTKYICTDFFCQPHVKMLNNRLWSSADVHNMKLIKPKISIYLSIYIYKNKIYLQHLIHPLNLSQKCVNK